MPPGYGFSPPRLPQITESTIRRAGRAPVVVHPPVDVPDQLRKLAELRDEGIPTEEFQAKKRDLLDRW
jgi:hypothetical protein